MTLKHLSGEEAELYHFSSAATAADDDTGRTYTSKVSLPNNHQRKTTVVVVEHHLPSKSPPPPPPPPPAVLADDHWEDCADDDDDDNNTVTTRPRLVRFGKVYKCTYRQRSPSKSERKSLWYSGKEIRDTRTAICGLNMSCANMDSKQHALLIEAYEEAGDSWRGLEHVRQGSLLQKVDHRRRFVQAFLYFSQELGVRNPNALAVFSANNSKLDSQRAMELAKQDALEACQIYYAFLTLENNTPEAQAAEQDGERQQQTTPKLRRQRCLSTKSSTSTTPSTDASTPRHPHHHHHHPAENNNNKKLYTSQVFNLTLSL